MRVNEIFYSIQGEGAHSGTPAVFIRLAGCNIKCPFCDTDHQPHTNKTEEEIVAAAAAFPAKLVVITGGEPSMQLTESLVDKLHAEGKYIAVETNGTRALPANVDWITISPKHQYVGRVGAPRVMRANELKLVFDAQQEVSDFGIKAEHYYLQPLDTGKVAKNEYIVHQLVEYVKQNPKWKISLQTHKILNVE